MSAPFSKQWGTTIRCGWRFRGIIPESNRYVVRTRGRLEMIGVTDPCGSCYREWVDWARVRPESRQSSQDSCYCPIALAMVENTLFALPSINRIVPTTKTKMTASTLDCTLRRTPLLTEGTGVSLATVLRVSTRSFRVQREQSSVSDGTPQNWPTRHALSSPLGQNQQYSATA